MLVYQLRIIELGESLEPVFKNKEDALRVKEKYKSRNIVIKEKYLDNIENDIIYRIKNTDCEGYFLEEEIFGNMNDAQTYLKNPHQSIVEYRLS